MGINQWTDTNASDLSGPGEAPTPRHGRAALLRLATWFEDSEPERADALADAVYALRPALHLEGLVDSGVAATTSWWQAGADRSAVVEHPGTRRPEPVRDHREQQARLRDAAESSAHWRRAGAEQIRALLSEPAEEVKHLELSGAGMEVLMELLTAALAAGDPERRPTSAGDLDFSLRLHVCSAPEAVVTVEGEGGQLTLEGLRLRVTPYEQHHLDPPGEAPRETRETEEAESHEEQDSSSGTVGDLPDTGNLPAPDPDTETTGPIEIATHRPWNQQRR